MDKLREVKVQIAFDLSYGNMLPGYTVHATDPNLSRFFTSPLLSRRLP